jgi:predicted PurR-regulated permease PerM
MPELLSGKMSRHISAAPMSTLTMGLVAVLTIAVLYFGREVLVPIALALLLSFVLAPLVSFLQRWYFPRVVAALVVGLFAFSTILGLGALMVSQVTQLAGDCTGVGLPQLYGDWPAWRRRASE